MPYLWLTFQKFKTFQNYVQILQKKFPSKRWQLKKIRKINFQVVPSQDFNWLLGNPVRVYTPLDQTIALENWNLLFFI